MLLNETVSTQCQRSSLVPEFLTRSAGEVWSVDSDL